MNTSCKAISKVILGDAVLSLCVAVGIACSAICASAQSLAPVQPAMKAIGGAHQDTAYGSTFAKPLTVWVTDPATHQSLSGIRIEFKPAAGIGLSDNYATTNEKGLAFVMATGIAATTSSATAVIPDFPSTQVSFDGLIVTKAVLTVVPLDMQAKSGGEIPAITDYTIQGFVHGDTEATANISGTPVLSTTATSTSPHANYAIKGSVGTLSAPNYTFVSGFGTMAILGNDNSNATASALPVLAEAGGDGTEVRPALEDAPVASAVAQPAFLAGLRGNSGVFVRAAIWQSSPTNAGNLQNANTRSAMPKVTTDRKNTVDAAAVRAVALPKQSNTGFNVAQPVNTHAAMPVAAALQPSYSESSIRKAWNPPGTK